LVEVLEALEIPEDMCESEVVSPRVTDAKSFVGGAMSETASHMHEIFHDHSKGRIAHTPFKMYGRLMSGKQEEKTIERKQVMDDREKRRRSRGVCSTITCLDS